MKNDNSLCSGNGLREALAMLAVAFLIVHFPFVCSCTSIDCPVQNTVSVNYGLMKGDGTADTMGVDTLWAWTTRADGKDTLLLNRLCGTSATKFTLPVSSNRPEDVFCLLLCDTTGNFWLDSVFVKKDDMPHFESVDCQASFFHTLTGVRCTHNALDSIVINNKSVTYDQTKTHIFIYIKPRR